jgi:hypothetical protein
VLINLIVNGIDAMTGEHDRPRELTIRTVGADGPSQWSKYATRAPVSTQSTSITCFDRSTRRSRGYGDGSYD